MEPPNLMEVIQRCKASCIEADLTEDYRFLRNFTTCLGHQQIIETFLNSGDLDSVFQRLEYLSNRVSQNQSSDVKETDLIQLRCGIQFIGNAVANNHENKLLVWPKLFPRLRDLLSSPDLSCRKYAMMVFYNCILNVPHHCNDIVNEDDFSVVIATLKLTFEDNCEWGLFFLDQLLAFPGFISNCHRNSMPRHLWIALLQLIHSNIIKSDPSVIDLSGLIFLEKIFIDQTDFVLSVNPPEYESEKLLEIVEILDVLCAATSAERYEAQLKLTTPDRRPAVLLCHTIALLKSVHLVTQMQLIASNKTVEELCNVPTYNFQKGLITLIANLCFKNTILQNKLREVDGIPLLLDCSKLNAKIPFISQWVVFAIRNACDDNLENQELIAQMNKLGLANVSL